MNWVSDKLCAITKIEFGRRRTSKTQSTKSCIHYETLNANSKASISHTILTLWNNFICWNLVAEFIIHLQLNITHYKNKTFSKLNSKNCIKENLTIGIAISFMPEATRRWAWNVLVMLILVYNVCCRNLPWRVYTVVNQPCCKTCVIYHVNIAEAWNSSEPRKLHS